MTKHWGRHGSLAPPVLAYLPSRSSVVKQDYHLDFTTGAQPSNAQANSPRARLSSPAPRWERYPSPWPVHDPHREAKFQVEPVVGASTSMDRAMHIDQDSRPVTFYPAPRPDLDATTKNHPVTHNSWDQEENAKGNRKKNYQRYPKPPYSYLAMIAMVIQNSPEKKLTLSQILKEISTLFPFFKGDYKGWRDSVRHNLSSYDCFVKVLKDPGKPQGKGNFWAVEVSRVPLELLKRQNTAVSRQDETVFAQDLAPYILHGQAHQTGATHSPPPSMPTRAAPPLPEEPFRPKLDSSFAIDSLLHSLRPSGAAGDGERAGDCWLQGPPGPPGPPSVSRPRRSSSSARSASASSASSASPASSSSDEDWRGGFHPGKRAPAAEAGSEGLGDCCPPHRKSSRRSTPLPWELPTSYAKYAPPNVVAPPSMRFNGGPFLPLGGLPYYSYGPPSTPPGHFVSHSYWPLLPSGRVPLQAPPLLMDLDRLLQSVPPNKSVFDVLGPSGPQTHPQPGPYGLQNRNPQY